MGDASTRVRFSARLTSAAMALVVLASMAIPAVAVGAIRNGPNDRAGAASAIGEDAWALVAGRPNEDHSGNQADLELETFQALRLDRNVIAALLDAAPRENLGAANRSAGTTLALPAPDGTFESFSIVDSPIMADEMAAKHPDIKTYRGVSLETGSTLRADLTPLGFHASVRGERGNWYIDPYYHLDQSLYASYFGRDLVNSHGPLVERDATNGELSLDRATYHPGDDVHLSASGFEANASISITVSDPTDNAAERSLTTTSDESGAFAATFVADPDGKLDMRVVSAADGVNEAHTSYQVNRDDDPTADPPTGDVLRTYRLALVTDPGYAAYHGGSANVTAAKVTLMNRVNQLYEEDLSIRMQFVGNNDLLNLDTWQQATAPNGPCGAAGCYAQADVTGCNTLGRNRVVIGQIIGATSYDIGHLALGAPGGGVAQFGVGAAVRANGCTGIPTPIGDYYAIDYVAHEMGHQFFGNHTFNGNQFNCSAGNRNGGTSVEPGSGQSIMAYAGICVTDDLSRHSDPYFSQRSLQEISTYTQSTIANINEIQTASLSHFGGGNEVQSITFAPGFQQAATIKPLTVSVGAAPSLTAMGGASKNGNVVTISTLSAGTTGAVHTMQVGDTFNLSGVPVSGYNGGPFTVSAVLTTRAFQFIAPDSTPLATTGTGTITLLQPGLTSSGTTVTVRTAAAHNRLVGDQVAIAGAGVGAYNGVVTITAVPDARSFQYTAIAPAAVAITTTTNATGTIATVNATAHGLAVGQTVTIAGNSVGAYNGTWTVLTVPNANSYTVDIGSSGNAAGSGGTSQGSVTNLPNSGAGTATYTTPFKLTIGGNDSGIIGSGGLVYSNANLTTAINAISGFAGTATVTGAGSTGFVITYTGASVGTDVPLIGITMLSCGPCPDAIPQETTHGGALDSFKLRYNGTDSATITNGTNYTSAGLSAALTSIFPAGSTFTLNAFGGGNISGLNNTGFQVTFTGINAATNLPFLLEVVDASSGMSGWFGQTVEGGPATNKGGIITATGNTWPTVTAPSNKSLPLRTPFSLTGSATDAEQSTLYLWFEQNNIGSTGIANLNQTKGSGPLFAMFPFSAQITDAAALISPSPGQNSIPANNPTRVFPDMGQIISNNTNADTGTCPNAAGIISNPVPQGLAECLSEFTPTSSYTTATPMSFRLTVRDGLGGVNAADVTLTLVAGTGPFHVSSPNTAVSYAGGSTQTVTWDVNGTNTPALAENVKISLSTDGGWTYPTVIAASTPNDGSEDVTIPNMSSTTARIKIEAVDNYFFDISNSDFTITAAGTTTTLLSDINPSVHGQGVTFTATVSSSEGIPTGTVEFKDGATTITGCSAVLLVAGSASCGPISDLSTSTHSITAVYSGDIDHVTSTSDALMQVVSQASTTTALVSDVNPSSYGDGVTFTATVSAVAPGAGTPTGTVEFKDGASTITGCAAVALVAGSASCGPVTDLSTSTHSITAVYSGDTDFTTSTSDALMQVVGATGTTTTVVSDINPSEHGEGVTFTATVSSSAGTPTGTVEFKDGATTITGCGAVALVAGSADCGPLTDLSTSTHSITAVYSGDTDFTTSTSDALMQVVNGAGTTTALGSDINPSVHGQGVTFTATVSSGAGTPTGTVEFKDGATTITGCAAVALVAGSASCGPLTDLSTSTHSITAVYSGDTDFTTSTSDALEQVVNQAGTTTAVVSDVNPSLSGEEVTFTATVSITAPGAGSPSGTVAFKSDSVDITGCEAVALSGGTAECGPITDLAIGDHAITAVYSGDTDFATSTSSALTQTVDAALRACTEMPFPDVPTTNPFCSEIQWMKESGISTGFEDGTYRPFIDVTRQAMAAFMARLADADLDVCDDPPFSDVPIDNEFCSEIQWMKAEGISTGFGDGTYRPLSSVTRQAMAAFMARLADADLDPCAEPPFSDVATDHPFCSEIQWMKAEGISTGFGDGTYRPATTVTRQAMAAFMARYAGESLNRLRNSVASPSRPQEI
jgi:hypothetical protein